MNPNLKWFIIGFISSLAVLVMFMFFAIQVVLIATQSNSMKMNVTKPYLQLALSGYLPEYQEVNSDIFTHNTLSAHEIIQKIKSAKSDSEVQALILKPNGFYTGYANFT